MQLWHWLNNNLISSREQNLFNTKGQISLLRVSLIWGLLHGLTDLTSAFLLTFITFQKKSLDLIYAYPLFAFLSFACQLPIGLWLDKTRKSSLFCFVSIVLLFFAILLFQITPLGAIICCGLASAGIHVVGSSICLQLNDGRSKYSGIFTSPGVLGLTAGIFAGKIISPEWLILLLIPIGFCIWQITKFGFPDLTYQKQNLKPAYNKFLWVLIGILILLCFRSFIFDCINYLSDNYYQGFIIIGFCAFAGKFCGGLLADKFGWKITLGSAIILALSFLLFGKGNIYLLGLAVICFQASVPISLTVLQKLLPNLPATVGSLALGTTIAIGGLPFFLKNRDNSIHALVNLEFEWILITLIILLLIWIVLRHFFRQKHKSEVKPATR
jgi:hypothetical protein